MPSDRALDPTPLVSSLRKTTTSYKHLFLRSVIGFIRDGQREIPLEDLFRAMLAEAWWPAFHYRLSLGKQDKVVARLKAEIVDPDELRLRPSEVYSYLEHIPCDIRKETATGLLRYVPQRLIAYWFAEEIASLPDGKRDAAIKVLSAEKFETTKPMYRIDVAGIVVHPDWFEVIRCYSGVFNGWVDAAWLSYLESKNPHATSLFSKIKPAFERSSLTPERRLWMSAKLLNLKCIYTGQSVDADLFALDHFLPHAFTGHDRFWNLTPVNPAINAQKSDRLPPREMIRTLAIQHASLWRSLGKLPVKEQAILNRMRDDYAADMGISDQDMTSESAMAAAYEATYLPLFDIASRMGFPNWAVPNK